MSNEINTTDEYIEITAENWQEFKGQLVEISQCRKVWTKGCKMLDCIGKGKVKFRVGQSSGQSSCRYARIKNPNYKPVTYLGGTVDENFDYTGDDKEEKKKPTDFVMNIENAEQARNVRLVLHEFGVKWKSGDLAGDYEADESTLCLELKEETLSQGWENVSKPSTTYEAFMDEFGYVLEKPDEQVEHNEMEEYLNPIDYDLIDHEAQFHILEIYNKLKAEKEEFKKDRDTWKEQNEILVEQINAEFINIPKDFTSEERQQLKDYAQKLRDDRISAGKYLVRGNGNEHLEMKYLSEDKRWSDRDDGVSNFHFDEFTIIKRLYTADELEGK